MYNKLGVRIGDVLQLGVRFFFPASDYFVFLFLENSFSRAVWNMFDFGFQ